MKPKKFTISEPVYNTSIRCVIGYPYSEIRTEHKKLFNSEYDGDIDDNCDARIIHCDNYLACILWTEDAPKKMNAYFAGLLSHECNHAAFHCMRGVGIRFSRDSEEAFAYLQQFYLQHILERCI